MAAKDRHRVNLLKFLGDPEEEFPKRKAYPGILSISKNTLYKHFSSEDLQEIEKEAVDIRRAASSRQRAKVLDSLYKRANGYSHPDIHIITNRVKTIDKDGMITEETVPLIVDIIKHYPPDKGAGQEFLDRTEGKVTEKRELTGKDGKAIETKSTLEAGPGIFGVLQSLKRATTKRPVDSDQGGNKE